MSGGDPCPRCTAYPCWCVYKPVYTAPPTLSDADVERIARRVVELMREEKR